MNKMDRRNPLHLLAFGLGAGLSPRAPGTFGTLVAVPLFLLMADLPLPVYLLLVVILFALGIPLCTRVSRDLGVHDHSGIVWDEIVGFLVTMTAAPAGWGSLVFGFLLFRLFDIWKPWPINALDRGVGGGLGIMLDDLLAGLYAAACLQLGVYFMDRVPM
ncbi:MAG: phosphatidylglycerophosphatase A [Pseudomonadota bacterium]